MPSFTVPNWPWSLNNPVFGSVSPAKRAGAPWHRIANRPKLSKEY
jgi:hypothetical protein